MVPLGRWVLMEACRQARRWQEEHPSTPPLSVGVNLSPRQLQHAQLPEHLAGALEASGLDPSCLVLEITEGVLMDDTERTTEPSTAASDVAGRRIVTENVKAFRPLLRRALEAGTPGPGLLFTSSRRFPRSRRNPAPLIEALHDWLGRPDVGRRPPEDWLASD